MARGPGNREGGKGGKGVQRTPDRIHAAVARYVEHGKVNVINVAENELQAYCGMQLCFYCCLVCNLMSSCTVNGGWLLSSDQRVSEGPLQRWWFVIAALAAQAYIKFQAMATES